MIAAIGAEQTITISGIGWGAVAGALIAAFLFARRFPGGGLGLIVASMPLYQVRGDLGIPVTLLELLLGSVILAVLTRWRRFRPVNSPYYPWLALWAGGALLASLLAPDPKQALGLWRAFFLEPAIFLAVSAAVLQKESPKPLAYGAAGAIGIVAVWTSALALSGDATTYDDRLAGPFQSANFIALLLVPLMLMLAGWPQRLSLLLRYLPIAAGLTLLFGSQSRGGLIALAVGGAVLLATKAGKTWLKKGAVVAAVGGTLLLSVFITIERQDNFSTRRVLWETSGSVIAKHPLLGSGPEHFQGEVRRRVGENESLRQFVVPRAPDAHNIFLVAWTEWGLAALLGFLGLLVTAVRSLRGAGRWAPPAAAMLTAIVGHGMIDSPVLKNDLAILFMLALLITVFPTRAAEGA